ncbi:acyl-CoA thioesterase [Leptospira kanakyensis]|uniref:Thioesterase n=1 Tax=Leptospira kanakyensis TaxID=2484968 RepID=A0A6N4Q858_9LEPT|nr:thioesterase family protein [Leptospira kanakyensis]MCW7470876.1 thioesterase family protein [Leptospira kanakyensis]TGK54442.1 thioesterase [Leptospira kanakyensis]TGK59090.1 thioesterase [Leptospira kanakyensis]TGK75240.1 thioesterase [Leptospira kanakyensis]
MARISIDIPEKQIYSTDLSVRISDINFAGHLAHDAILTLTHECRARFFHSHGWTEINVEGKGIVVSDVAIVYKSEAFFPDDLMMQLFVDNVSKKSLEMVYVITHKNGGKEIARAKTAIVFFDYAERKPCPIPEVFLKVLI